MKRIRVFLTSLAFATAMAGAMATNFYSNVNSVFGTASGGVCVPGQLVQPGCATTNSGPQCSAYLPSTNEIVPAAWKTSLCMTAYRRP